MTEIPPTVPPGGSYTPPPPPSTPPPGANSDRTIMLVLSYLGLLALIPLLTKKDDREIQWHAWNGLFLTIAYIVVYIIWAVIQAIIPDSIGCLAGPVILAINCGLWIGWIALAILGITKATSGQRMRYPVISEQADKMVP